MAMKNKYINETEADISPERGICLLFLRLYICRHFQRGNFLQITAGISAGQETGQVRFPEPDGEIL